MEILAQHNQLKLFKLVDGDKVQVDGVYKITELAPGPSRIPGMGLFSIPDPVELYIFTSSEGSIHFDNPRLLHINSSYSEAFINRTVAFNYYIKQLHHASQNNIRTTSS